jgi:predicted DNA-binding transcriptional regulator YafY
MRLPYAAEGKGLTVRDLLDDSDLGLSVEHRQLRKRLSAMEQAGFVKANRDGKTTYWMAADVLDQLTARRQSAIAYSLFEQLAVTMPSYWADSFKSQLSTARRRRNEDMSLVSGRWPERFAVAHAGFSLQPPAVEAEVVAAVKKALAEDKGLVGRYWDPLAENYRRHEWRPPLCLLAKGPESFVYALDAEGEPQAWALHRMKDVRVSGDLERHTTPFNFQEFIRKGGDVKAGERGQGTEVFEAWVDEGLARQFKKHALYRGATLTLVQPGDMAEGAMVRHHEFPLLDTDHFDGYVIAHGGSMVCHYPLRYRRKIIGRFKAAVEAYEKVVAAEKPPQAETAHGRACLDVVGALEHDRGDHGPERLEAWTSKAFGDRFGDTDFCEGAKFVPVDARRLDLGCRLSATLILTQDVQNYIVSRAEEFVVLSPVRLRDEVLRRHRNALEAYRRSRPVAASE